MAGHIDQGTQMPASIASILEKLSNRPNVQSTLIISRKDGSIINATGPASQSSASSGVISRPYQGSEYRERSQDAVTPAHQARDAEAKSESIHGSRELTYTERLAASIIDFVDAAVALGSRLDLSEPGDNSDGKPNTMQTRNRTEGPAQPSGADDEDETKSKDQEVQLLRMRTRRQEIIIFPDTNYLCCVVQNAGKYGATA